MDSHHCQIAVSPLQHCHDCAGVAARLQARVLGCLLGTTGLLLTTAGLLT